MGKYRKIDPVIWNDEKFMRLSAHGKLACFFMLTHPHMTSIGCIRGTVEGLSYELKDVAYEDFKEAFAEGIALESSEAPIIWFPNFIKYNKPESPNVVKAWRSSLDLLPSCNLKKHVIITAYEFLKDFKEVFAEAFAIALPKDYAYTGTGAGTDYYHIHRYILPYTRKTEDSYTDPETGEIMEIS